MYAFKFTYNAFFTCYALFRCASNSSTYPCLSVRWSVGPSVTLSDFQSVSISGRPTWKVKERGPQLFFHLLVWVFLTQKTFLTQKLFWPKNFFDQRKILPYYFGILITFLTPKLFFLILKSFLTQKTLLTKKTFLTQKTFLAKKTFLTQTFWEKKENLFS